MRLRAGWVVMPLAMLAVTSCTTWSSELARWELTEEPTGDTVHVQAVYGGSSCTRFEEWQVQESESAVTVEAVIERSNASDCTANEVYESASLQLSEELDDRRLTGCLPERDDEECRDVVVQPTP